MIAIVITNSPRKRYTFHFEDSNEAKNIATLLGKGEEWKKYDRVVTSRFCLLRLFKMETKDYTQIITNNKSIKLSSKDRLAIKFFLNLIHNQMNLEDMENSTVIIECSAYKETEVSIFKGRIDNAMKAIFNKLTDSNVANTTKMGELYTKVKETKYELFSAMSNGISDESIDIFQQFLLGMNQYKHTVEEYIDTMKKENLIEFAIYKDEDLETIREKSDFLGVRFEKLMNDNIAQNPGQVELNKPMSSKITFFIDSDGSDFTKFFLKSKKMNIKRDKIRKKWRYSYKLDDYTLHSNNSELTNSVLPYIFRLGLRNEFYQKLDFCVLNGNLEIIMSSKLKKVGSRYNPKITLIQNDSEDGSTIQFEKLKQRMNDLKYQFDYVNESGPVKIKHFTNRELNLINKNLSLDNSEVCLYLSHPSEEEEEEIFEWVKEEDLDKLCNCNESFTYLDCAIIRDKPKKNEITVRFSRFFLDEEV